MSKYQQLSSAYALNHQALIDYRHGVRDAAVKIRDAVSGELGVGSRGTQIVSLHELDGRLLMSSIAKLEHGEPLNFSLAITLGGGGELPEIKVFTSCEICKQADNLVLKIDKFGLHQVLDNDVHYRKVAEAIFDGVMVKLKDF